MEISFFKFVLSLECAIHAICWGQKYLQICLCFIIYFIFRYMWCNQFHITHGHVYVLKCQHIELYKKKLLWVGGNKRHLLSGAYTMHRNYFSSCFCCLSISKPLWKDQIKLSPLLPSVFNVLGTCFICGWVRSRPLMKDVDMKSNMTLYYLYDDNRDDDGDDNTDCIRHNGTQHHRVCTLAYIWNRTYIIETFVCFFYFS